MRDLIFENDEVYHIYNRGVDKRSIVETRSEAERFVECLKYFNTFESFGGLRGLSKSELKFLAQTNELVDIVTYCLNPNHFHILLRQKIDGGISKFMERVSQGYTQYFNRRNDRSGSLFEGTYKAAYVGEGDHFDYIGTYVGRNDEVHGYRLNQRKYVRRGFDEIENGIEVCNAIDLLVGESGTNSYREKSNRLLNDIRENKLQAQIRKEFLTFT